MYCIILVVTIFINLSLGYVKISFIDLLKVFTGQGSFVNNFIIFNVRLPRLLITLLVGIALAISGLILQTVSKNDLSDPSILGINTGAGIGVAFAYLMLNFSSSSILYMIPLFALIGGITMFALILFVSSDRLSGFNPQKLILTGIGTSIASSGFMILMVSSSERADVQFIYEWLGGNIWGDKMVFVYAILPWILVSLFIILKKIRILNILNLDEISATSLGINLNKERLILVICAVVLASVSVAVAGTIAFIGLIIPHLSKRIFGNNHKHNIIPTALLGAIILMNADLIGRTFFTPQTIPAGVMVSLIGAPYFLYLLFKKK